MTCIFKEEMYLAFGISDLLCLACFEKRSTFSISTGKVLNNFCDYVQHKFHQIKQFFSTELMRFLFDYRLSLKWKRCIEE